MLRASEWLLILFILTGIAALSFLGLSSMDRGHMPSLLGLGAVLLWSATVILYRFVAPIIVLGIISRSYFKKKLEPRTAIITCVYIGLTAIGWLLIPIPS